MPKWKGGSAMKLQDLDFRIWHKDSDSFVDMKVSDTDLRIIPTNDDSYGDRAMDRIHRHQRHAHI